MRGLKPLFVRSTISVHEVASFTDAWIETLSGSINNVRLAVASFTDAWIETFILMEWKLL